MKIRFTAVIGGLCLAAIGSANAATWVEQGDAGDILTGFQVTSGSGPLDAIVGDTGGGADAFLITIVDPSAFYATTNAIDGLAGTGAASFDTMISLFSADGSTPLLQNDDSPAPGTGTLSTITDPSTWGGVAGPGAASLTPGDYVLVINGWNNEPNDGAVPLFIDSGGGFEELRGPDPAAGPLAAYGTGTAGGTYTIELGGAGFAIPEPSAGILALLGLATLLRRRR